MLRGLCVVPGHFTLAVGQRKNTIPMQNMDLKTSSKMRRKKLHNVRKGFIDAHVEKGVTYEAGRF